MTKDALEQEIKDLQGKYREAVFRESAIREISFLPIDLDICGIKVKQFTPKHYILLDFMGSAFITGRGEIDAGTIAEFLWIVSAEYEDEAPDKKEAFIKGLINYDAEQIINEIKAYIDDAFMDLSREGTQGSERESQTPYYAWICTYIDLLGSEYGYKDDYVLNMPIARILQYARVIECRKARALGKEPFLVNNLSDDVKAQLRLKIKKQLEKETNG